MKPNSTRSAAIVIHNDAILLMRRIKNGKEYWVFPGGTVEDGETPEEAAIREVFEETSITVSIDRLLYKQTITDMDSVHYFYRASYVSGDPHIQPDSPEAKKMLAGNETYDPQWYPLDTIEKLTLYPIAIRDILRADIRSDFSDNPRESTYTWADVQSR